MFALFKLLYFVGFFFIYAMLAGLIAISSIPAAMIIARTWQATPESGLAELLPSLFFAFLGILGSLVLLMFVTALLMRLLSVIVPLREGRSSVYGMQMVVWSVNYMMMNFLNNFFLPVFRTTPLMNLFYRLLGAKIDDNVFFNSSFIYEPQLVQVGANSRIGENAVIVPHTTEGQSFICKKIIIGRNVTIGQYAQILPGAQIGDGAVVGAGAIVPKDYVVEPHAIYGGNPLRLIRHKQHPAPSPAIQSPGDEPSDDPPRADKQDQGR